MVKLLLLPKIN